LTTLESEEEKNHRFLSLFTANESSIHAYVRRLVYRREDASDVRGWYIAEKMHQM